MDTSYDFANLVRDVAETFVTLSKGQTNLLGAIKIKDTAKQFKHEWYDDRIEATADALDGAILVGDTEITVDAGTKFSVGDIIAFDGYDEVMRVTVVDGDDLTVTRAYGGTSAIAMADDTVVHLVSRPKAEGSDPGYDAVSEPTTEYNFTQIFDRTAKITKSAAVSDHHSIGDIVDFHVKHHLELLQMELNAACIYGRRYANTGDDTIPRTMGGIPGDLLKELNRLDLNNS